MTFFAGQKKRFEEKGKGSTAVGPGSYLTAGAQTPESKSYAPFGSLSHKTVKANKKEIVGPGRYQVSKNIVKPSVQQFENENCIIIKINDEGSSQFKSVQQRFQHKASEDTPGPGSYNPHKEENMKKRKRSHSTGSSMNKMKLLYKNQYLDKRKPTLESDPIYVPEQQSKVEKKPKGVVRWDLNRKERFHSEPKQYFSEEDKSMIIDKMQMDKKRARQNKQSSFFASKSVKSCFDEMVYRSKNPHRVELLKMFGFDDPHPGPGAYNLSTKTHQKNKSHMQFFGSTVKRFQESQQNCVGPGQYFSEEKGRRIKPELKLKKTETRSKVQPETEDESNLGPGAYEIENIQLGKNSYNSSYNMGTGAFGSKRPRFQDKNDHSVDPRPEYISFMAQEDEERKMRIEEEFRYRRNVLKNKKQPMFLSQSKRNCFEDSEPKKKIPFGSYEVGIQDISTRIKKQKQFSHQFSQCNLSKPGFLSTVERFKTQKEEAEGHQDCWCRIKEVEKKSIQHNSYVFNSGAKRTEIFDVKKKGPDVGQYNSTSSMIKNSFNSRFIKQSENKTKKLKIWKDKKTD